MRQRVPFCPSLALIAGLALAAPAFASERPHVPVSPSAAQRPLPPDLLAQPHIDIPQPEHHPADVVVLAAGESIELPVIITTLFQPGWDDLDETQQEILAPFAPEWNTWPTAERRSWLAFADRMQQLPEAQRQRARRRIIEWANLSPEERRIARLNHQNARRRPMPERVKEWERYQGLSYAERERLRHSERANDIAAVQRARAGGMPPPAGRMPPSPDKDVLIVILRPGSAPPPQLPPPPAQPGQPLPPGPPSGPPPGGTTPGANPAPGLSGPSHILVLPSADSLNEALSTEGPGNGLQGWLPPAAGLQPDRDVLQPPPAQSLGQVRNSLDADPPPAARMPHGLSDSRPDLRSGDMSGGGHDNGNTPEGSGHGAPGDGPENGPGGDGSGGNGPGGGSGTGPDGNGPGAGSGGGPGGPH